MAPEFVAPDWLADLRDRTRRVVEEHDRLVVESESVIRRSQETIAIVRHLRDVNGEARLFARCPAGPAG